MPGHAPGTQEEEAKHSRTAVIDQCIDYHMQMTIYFLVFCIFTMGTVLTLQTVFHLFLHLLKKRKERAETRQAVWLAQTGRRVCLDKHDYRPSSCKTSKLILSLIPQSLTHLLRRLFSSSCTYNSAVWPRFNLLYSQNNFVCLLKPYIKMPSSQGACIQLQACSKWDLNDLKTLLFRNPEEKVAPLWLSLPPLKVILLVVRQNMLEI